MFRTLCCVAALLALIAVPLNAASAQLPACKKVSLTGTCGDGKTKVTTGGTCKAGESKGDCCARALDQAFAACKAKGVPGVIDYECDCTDTGGMPQGDVEEPDPDATAPGEPRLRSLQPAKPAISSPGRPHSPRCGCARVGVRYFCRTDRNGYASRPCKKGETTAACCRRWESKLCGGADKVDRTKTTCECVKWRKCGPMGRGTFQRH